MKKSIFVILLVFLIIESLSQCAYDYNGIYKVKPCDKPDSLTNYMWNSIITPISPNQLLISNFANIPGDVFSGGEEDTIIADLNCINDLLYLQTISFQVYEGYLIYSGSGQIYSDSIRIEFYQANPDNTHYEYCQTFKKGGIDEIFHPSIGSTTNLVGSKHN